MYGMNIDIEYGIDQDQLESIFSLPKNTIECLAFSILATDEGHAAIFSWPDKYKKCYKFVYSILNQKIENIPTIVLQFAFTYIENTFFAEKWWTSLSDEQKHKISQLASITDPYGTAFKYSKDNFVEWKVTKIIHPAVS